MPLPWSRSESLKNLAEWLPSGKGSKFGLIYFRAFLTVFYSKLFLETMSKNRGDVSFSCLFSLCNLLPTCLSLNHAQEFEDSSVSRPIFTLKLFTVSVLSKTTKKANINK